jgi:anti-sigma factor RsiW
MNTVNENERSEIEELLPWHAAGTLSRRDAQRVEAALASDPELARRYALVREELGQTIHLNESLGAPSPRVMETLFAKIDAEPARRPAMASGVGARIGEFFASLTPRTLAWSAAVAAVAILLQAGFIADMVITNKGPGGYQTASVPGAVKGEGSYALIRFQPQASAADVAKFLETNKLTIAGGPTAGGLYKVQIAPAVLGKDALAARIKALQEDKVVGFIGATD